MLNVLPAEGSNSRTKLPADLAIEPGKTTEITIPLEGPPASGRWRAGWSIAAGSPSPVPPCSSRATPRPGPKPRPARMGDSP